MAILTFHFACCAVIMIKVIKGERMRYKHIARKGTTNWKIHPGEILREEFLKPLSMSVYALAKRLHVPVPRLNDIVLEKRGVSADTAVRLSRFFGTTEQF
jgi:addiction module HigA family antidote